MMNHMIPPANRLEKKETLIDTHTHENPGWIVETIVVVNDG